MRALSIQQPWAYAILHLGKDIENRQWSTGVRGRVYIHAGKAVDHDGVAELRRQGFVVPDRLPTGGLVGSVEILNCVRESDSPWFVGLYGFVLRDPRPVPFTPCRGFLGFFEPIPGEGVRHAR